MDKICKKCSIDKPVADYAKQSTGKYGVRSICKVCIKEIREAEKLDSLKEARRKMYHKKSRAKHSIKNAQYMKMWYSKNPQKYSEYYKKRVSTPVGKLRQLIRSRMWSFLKTKGMNKKGSFIQALGITTSELKEYLESKFTSEMNWSNYGSYWNIDHIVPLDSAENIDDVYRLSHYTNLQPLERIENFKKSNKI